MTMQKLYLPIACYARFRCRDTFAEWETRRRLGFVHTGASTLLSFLFPPRLRSIIHADTSSPVLDMGEERSLEPKAGSPQRASKEERRHEL